jgi:hypothetical protein
MHCRASFVALPHPANVFDELNLNANHQSTASPPLLSSGAGASAARAEPAASSNSPASAHAVR